MISRPMFDERLEMCVTGTGATGAGKILLFVKKKTQKRPVVSHF